jgi:hypothetical protein
VPPGMSSVEFSHDFQVSSDVDLVLGTIIIPFCIILSIVLQTMPVLPIIAVGFSPCAAGRHSIVAPFGAGFIGAIAPVEAGAIAGGEPGAIGGGAPGAVVGCCARAAPGSARNAALNISAARRDFMEDLSARERAWR